MYDLTLRSSGEGTPLRPGALTFLTTIPETKGAKDGISFV